MYSLSLSVQTASRSTTNPQDPTGLGYVLPRPLDSSRDPTICTSTAVAGPETTAVPAPPPTGWGTIIMLPAAQRLLPHPPVSPLVQPFHEPTEPNQHQIQRHQGEYLSTAGSPKPQGPKPSTGSPTKPQNATAVAATAVAATAVAITTAAGGGGDLNGGSWSSLAAGLVAQVRPGVLLFLRRVRQLEVVDELTGVRHKLRRVDREGGAVVEVTWCVEALGTGEVLRETVHMWIVGAATLAPPLVTRGSAAARPPATTVKVALPLPAHRRRHSSRQGVGEGGARSGDLEVDGGGGQLGMATSSGETASGANGYDDPWVIGCYVYATLPLRPSGLPFDLQADWLVPSSREDISGGEAWNQMLRDQVPAAFLAAVRHATNILPHMRRGAWLRYVPYNHNHNHFQPPVGAGFQLPLRPRSGAVAPGGGGGGGGPVTMPFLRPVVGAVAAALRATPCILSYNSDGSEGEMLRPSQVVAGAGEELRLLLPSTALEAATGFRYAVTDGLAAGLELSRELTSDGTVVAAGGAGPSRRGDDGAALKMGSSDPRVAAVVVESLPASGVLTALGLQVFCARHAVATLHVMFRSDATTAVGKAAAAGPYSPFHSSTSSAVVSRHLLTEVEAAAGGAALWRWRVLASLEGMFEEAEASQDALFESHHLHGPPLQVQQAHGAVAGQTPPGSLAGKPDIGGG
ncbi:hypothetical protein Vafri_15433, partial [Volvox africanus]